LSDAAKASADTSGAGSLLPQRVSGRSGRPHRSTGADRAKAAADERSSGADRAGTTQIHNAASAERGAEGGACSELRRTGDEARSYTGTEYAEPEQGKAREHQAHRLADVGLLALESGRELAEVVGTDADDDRQHHHLYPRAHHIAEHSLGKEAGPVPQRKRNEDEAGEARQLKFEDGDKHLHREDEEGDDDDCPSEQQHRDRQEIVEEAGEAHQLGSLLKERPGGGESGAGEPPGLQKIVGR